MDWKLEVKMYDEMDKTLDEIEKLQSRIYGFTCIPLDERDYLSRELFKVRSKLLDHANKLGESLVVMGAFD